jgi:hypothetical protein
MTYRFLSLAALLLQLSGQLAAQETEKPQTLKTCTLLSCISAAAISIQLSDGGTPKYDVTLDIDGTKVVCTLPELSAYIPFGTGASCGSTANMSVQEESPGKIEALLVIHSRPKRIAISLLASGKTVAERVFLPEYTEHSPNGPNCEPQCWSWRTTWMI